MGESRAIEFSGPAGRIEGILQGRPDDRALRSAIVCHPHPLGGGTMHTKVVHRAARALEASAHRVLRFNFRGVGRSEGVHDRGRGEQDDVGAALDYVAAIDRNAPVTMVGFSFGSFVGLAAGWDDPRVDALVGIAIPANLYDFSFPLSCPKPKLLIHGTGDMLAPLAALEEIYPSIAPPKTLVRLDGASHLLTERLDEVEEAVLSFGRSLPRPRSS